MAYEAALAALSDPTRRAAIEAMWQEALGGMADAIYEERER